MNNSKSLKPFIITTVKYFIFVIIVSTFVIGICSLVPRNDSPPVDVTMVVPEDCVQIIDIGMTPAVEYIAYRNTENKIIMICFRKYGDIEKYTLSGEYDKDLNLLSLKDK